MAIFQFAGCRVSWFDDQKVNLPLLATDKVTQLAMLKNGH
jgi:hypothetical protein